MKGLPFLLATLTAFVSSADLDQIDADGVTEIGGSPQFGRMLTRTKATGFLDASLLPSIADWASKPISNLYYAAGNATVQGNGSPQYPFQTLTYALGHLAPDSALILAPATYTGVGTLASGRTLTLVGYGVTPFVSSLTLEVAGTSADTTLQLCNLRVGTLSLSGGRVNVRLSGSSVNLLEGTAGPVTVTRTDLGATIRVSTLAHTDVYVGYDYVPKAGQVVSSDGTSPLTLSTGRARVGVAPLAFLSDVASATNAVYARIGQLEAEDTRLEGLITAETSNRQGGDAALSNRLTATVAELRGEIADIGLGWSEQLSEISAGISTLGTSLTQLRSDHEADVVVIEGEIAAARAAAAADNTNLLATVRGEIADSVADLRGDVPQMAATVFDTRIYPITNHIYQVLDNLQDEYQSATNRLTLLETWRRNLGTTNSLYRIKINEIIDCLELIQQGRASQITVPTKL